MAITYLDITEADLSQHLRSTTSPLIFSIRDASLEDAHRICLDRGVEVIDLSNAESAIQVATVYGFMTSQTPAVLLPDTPSTRIPTSTTPLTILRLPAKHAGNQSVARSSKIRSTRTGDLRALCKALLRAQRPLFILCDRYPSPSSTRSLASLLSAFPAPYLPSSTTASSSLPQDLRHPDVSWAKKLALKRADCVVLVGSDEAVEVERSRHRFHRKSRETLRVALEDLEELGLELKQGHIALEDWLLELFCDGHGRLQKAIDNSCIYITRVHEARIRYQSKVTSKALRAKGTTDEQVQAALRDVRERMDTLNPYQMFRILRPELEKDGVVLVTSLGEETSEAADLVLPSRGVETLGVVRVEARHGTEEWSALCSGLAATSKVSKVVAVIEVDRWGEREKKALEGLRGSTLVVILDHSSTTHGASTLLDKAKAFQEAVTRGLVARETQSVVLPVYDSAGHPSTVLAKL